MLRRPTAGRRLAGLAFLLTTLLLLGGCMTTPPKLGTSADGFVGLALTGTSVTLRNEGGGRLEWRARTDHPAVSVAPARGQLGAGASVELRITVDPSGVDKGERLEAELLIESNGGDLSFRLSYESTSGIGQCGAYTPIELTAAHTAAAARPVGDEVIVGYRAPSGLTPQATAAAVASARVAVGDQYGLTPLRVGGSGLPDLVRAPAGDVDAFVARLAADPRVSYVQRNYYVELQHVPTDAYYGSQWSLSSFGLEQAWDLQRGDDDPVIIAVIDSGVQRDHPDLAGGKTLLGFDFNEGAPGGDPGATHPDDPAFFEVAHGTHVAGIAAAIGDDVGVTGVAFGPNVRILPIKVFDDRGENADIYNHLIPAIRWAAGLPVPGMPLNPDKAQIINMSLGLPGRHAALDAVTREAWDAGVLLIAAAGNHGNGIPDHGVLSPANAPCVIAVGSVDADRGVSEFSNTGVELELVAPGGFGSALSDPLLVCASTSPTVVSTVPGDYACMAGTSMATPFVAGVAALLMSQGDHVTPAQVRDRLSETTERAEWMSDPRLYGNGIVCADLALGANTRCGAPLD